MRRFSTRLSSGFLGDKYSVTSVRGAVDRGSGYRAPGAAGKENWWLGRRWGGWKRSGEEWWELTNSRPLLVLCIRIAGMKRVGRMVLNGLTGLSLLLFVAMIFVYLPSFNCQIIVNHVRWPREFQGINCSNGSLKLWTIRQPMTDRPEGWSAHTSPAVNQFDGIVWKRGVNVIRGTQSYLHRGMTIPLWYFLVVTSIAPLVSVWNVARNRRPRQAGFCATCGYDLRATPNRCPECGTLPAKANA